MNNRERQLEELYNFVQELRENGDTDLRIILHIIQSMQKDENYTLKEE